MLSKGRDDEKGTMLQRRGLDELNTQGNYQKYQEKKRTRRKQLFISGLQPDTPRPTMFLAQHKYIEIP